MKRFSWMVFCVVVVVHVIGTILLLDAGFAALRAEKQAAASALPPPSFLWLTILSWIWYPIPRLIRLFVGPLSPSAFFYLIFLWSLCLGAAFGFLVPHLRSKQHQSPNQSLEPTAGRRDAPV